MLTCDKQVSYAEIVGSAAKSELFSPDPEQVTLQMPIDQIIDEPELCRGMIPRGWACSHVWNLRYLSFRADPACKS